MHNSKSPQKFIIAALAAGLWPACAPAEDAGSEGAPAPSEGAAATALETLAAEDGLAEAYDRFKRDFGSFADSYPIGAGHHPGLSTEKLSVNGFPASARITLNFASRTITATLSNVPTNTSFDLFLVKNKPNTGTVRPESADTRVLVGSFVSTGPNTRSLFVENFAQINFDLDMVVVSRKGQNPTNSRVLVGARTLLEKRFFRERAGGGLDPVLGTLAVLKTVETEDRLVQRGAFLFFNDTFGGNGRTCGTCHPPQNDLTMDAASIGALPSTDPMFVFRKPGLGELEDNAALVGKGLIRVNSNGFDKPATLRSIPHVLGMGTGLSMSSGFSAFPVGPPEQLTGWSGDGSTGRGTLNEFAFMAVMQHFPKNLARRPGTDFRIPTQEDLDAIEAFMLFTGRQRRPDLRVLTFRDAPIQQGSNLFFDDTKGRCAGCHVDSKGGDGSPLVNTGTSLRDTSLPADDGFKQPFQGPPLGDGRFASPPIFEAADTLPSFHNNSARTIEDAVAHYTSNNFAQSPGGGGSPVNLTPAETDLVAAFMRVVNAAENARQSRKRVEFVQRRPATDPNKQENNPILDVAIVDTDDAIRVLAEKGLNAAARQHLGAAKAALVSARGQADNSPGRNAQLATARTNLALAHDDLLIADPATDF